MNKKFLALAVAAAMTAPMVASADAVMYGKLRVAVENHDDGAGYEAINIRNHSSRIGVKGSEDLGDGLKAIYMAEFGVDIGGGPESLNTPSNEFGGTAQMSARNAYVGLAGNWGTLLLGRHDTPMKMSTGRLDYFGDQAGDYNYGYSGMAIDLRANGTLAYVTPSMGGLTVAAALVPGENSQADGIADAYSVAAMYSNSGFYASAAIEGADQGVDADTALLNSMYGVIVDTEITQTRIGLGYDGGSWKVGGVWANVDLDDLNADADYWHVNGAYSFGNNTIKAKYFDSELMIPSDPNANGVDGFAIGFDHALSKRTDINVTYVDNDADQTVWGIGMNHAF